MFTSQDEIKSILLNKNPRVTEQLAQDASRLTEQYFGRTIALYSPLYLSNYCSSHCTYCGFSTHHRIQRLKLTEQQMQQEMSRIAQTGIKSILLLTGESYRATPLSYLKQAIEIAKPYFSSIALEVHPMETEEYRELFLSGADGVTIYQETYDRQIYQQLHLTGKKSDYDYRFATPKRIAPSGIRHISMGILLGLSEPAADLWTLYQHLRWMERHYPGVEYSLSFPRLRTIKGEQPLPSIVDDETFIKIICLTRKLFPRVGINLSTRESAHLRDHTLGLGVTRISAGSNTSVGGYSLKEQPEQDPQFDIKDNRSVAEIVQLLKMKNFDPVLTDWRYIGNTT